MFRATFKALLVPLFTFTLSGTAISSQFEIEYLCQQSAVCHYADPATGMYFTLPNEWGAERAFYYETAGGARAEYPTQVYVFRPHEADPFVAVLNPRQWIGMNGPCAQTWRGQLCHFESMDDRHLADFQILWTSLDAMPLGQKPLSAGDIATILNKLSSK